MNQGKAAIFCCFGFRGDPSVLVVLGLQCCCHGGTSCLLGRLMTHCRFEENSFCCGSTVRQRAMRSAHSAALIPRENIEGRILPPSYDLLGASIIDDCHITQQELLGKSDLLTTAHQKILDPGARFEALNSFESLGGPMCLTAGRCRIAFFRDSDSCPSNIVVSITPPDCGSMLALSLF